MLAFPLCIAPHPKYPPPASILHLPGCRQCSSRWGASRLTNTAGRAAVTEPPPPFEFGVQAVQLSLGCLSFDFVGTCLDESSEDLGTIQARGCVTTWAICHC